MTEQNLKKKLNIMIVIVVLLVCCLTVTSAALANAVVSVQNNRFSMSMGVSLNVNNGDPVVDMTDVVYEPGGTYKREFPITNNSTFDVWYRVYFTDVSGGLSNAITVTVKEADGTVLCRGTMAELTAGNVAISSLAAGESKTLTVEFYFSPDAGNGVQGQSVSFRITANATQKKNNPDKDFGE